MGLAEDGMAIEGGAHTHGDHGGDEHAGHEAMFRKWFFISTALSVPVLFWSETIQGWFSYSAPEFPGSFLIVPVLATFIFVYGAFPFLTLAKFELQKRSPAMMTPSRSPTASPCSLCSNRVSATTSSGNSRR